MGGYDDIRSRESETPNFDRYGGSNIGPKIMDQSEAASEALSQMTYGARPQIDGRSIASRTEHEFGGRDPLKNITNAANFGNQYQGTTSKLIRRTNELASTSSK